MSLPAGSELENVSIHNRLSVYDTMSSNLNRLPDLIEIQKDFVNNITHEFKTPISTISIACESLNEPGLLIEKNSVTRYSKIIKEESLYLAQGYELVNVKSIKNKKFSLIFGDTASSVEKFIGENSLRLSQEADLILIFQYANDALKKKEGT